MQNKLVANMESHRHCNRVARALNVDDIKGAFSSVIMESQNNGNNHLPHARARSIMNAQDNVNNDLRQILKHYGIRFFMDLARLSSTAS